MKKIEIYFNLAFVSFLILYSSCKENLTSGFANVNGTSIYYEMKGTGIPIVFIHGFACDLRNWDNQFELFSKNYKVIRYDLRGFGKSSLPDTIPYSHADDLSALLEFLKIDKVILVGHSLGGGVAIYYTLEHPKKVFALIVAEGGAPSKTTLEKSNTLNRLRMPAIKIAQTEGVERGKNAWLNMEIYEPAMKNSKSVDKLKLMTAEYSGWHWVNKDPQLIRILEENELFQIKVPTLIMTGELSRFEYHDVMELIHTNISKSKIVLINKSGHMLNLENPDQFNREVLTFLRDNNLQ